MPGHFRLVLFLDLTEKAKNFRLMQQFSCGYSLILLVQFMATMSTTIAVKTKRVKKDFTVYNELAMRQNNFILEYSRTSMSALSGAAAGILGLTGLYGFIFFFIMAFVLSFLLLLKAGSNWSKYFPSRKMLFLSGQFGGLFTYVLFWTFLYGMVHVY